MRGKITRIIVAIILLALAGLIGVSTYNNQQQKTTASRASESDNWAQCNDTFSNAPCGICNVTSVTDGNVGFSCRLVCSGTGETCPGGVGTQKITGKWISCSQTGEETCDSSKTDFKEEGVITNSPWTLNRGLTEDYTGTFPQLQCGRLSVELLMDAPGVDVAGAIYDTQIACNLPTSTPTAILTLMPSTTATPEATLTTTPTVTITPTQTITPSTVLSPTVTPPPALPQSGIPAPFIFIALPLMLVLLGLAL